MRTFIRWVLSILFWSFFVSSCAVLFFVALGIFVVTLPFDRRGTALHLFSCFWAQLYINVNPLWRCRIEGRERIAWDKPVVLVSNHESLGDILVLFGLYRPFKWVSKASVFNAPFLGWNMSLNRYVPIRRGDKDSVAKMMAACRTWLDRGVPVLLFPEGTRSPDGRMLPFKDGAFRLAREANVPIQPMVLTGTSHMLPKHGILIELFADFRVKILDPIDPHTFPDEEALKAHVRAVMLQAKAELGSPEA